MEKLTDLPNISPRLGENLNRIGVTTLEELRALGAEGAFLRIRAQVASTSWRRWPTRWRGSKRAARPGAQGGAENLVLGIVRRMLCFA